MVPWVWNIRKGIIGQKLICFAQFRALGIKVLFEVTLEFYELLFCLRVVFSYVLLNVNIWVLNIHHEVYLKVEFKLFICKILFAHILRDKLVKSLEEFRLEAFVEALLDDQQELGRGDVFLLALG